MVPPALSIPLGTSGSSVDVVKEENGTFSINGETITAETRVTAENGNVYRALLSPEGLPIGVDHVAAMQDVMLGSLGGTITLTQSEDKSWKLGDITVTDGYVHTAANGNMYALMMDADGMWSGTYQEVMVTVALGTQGSVTLTRAEDMSWWLGSEAVMTGSTVNSANGNEYMLSMSNGDWTAMFQPESMMIEGTGLTAMTREGDDMYDVGDDTLPASGVGDVTVDGAMYHVWMMDGALSGARFDKAIVAGNMKIGSIDLPGLTANDPDTVANETRTHLIVTGTAATGEGMFSIGSLLGGGVDTQDGPTFVAKAAEDISKVRSDVDALLALDSPPDTLRTILGNQWGKVKVALDTIFNTQSTLTTGATSAVRQATPRNDDILDDIDDILDALATVDTFVAATKEDGDGVFESRALSASDATNAFDRVMWTATASMGATGSTRYGTAVRKTTDFAVNNHGVDEVGAFSYSTMAATGRTSQAAAVSLTGTASYSGGTEAISGDGVRYSGAMDVQVRFSAETVSGVVKDLVDADGMPWQYNFADVDKIVLNDGTLRRNATWAGSGATGTVFFTAGSGLLRPQSNLTNTFKGVLLGTGDAAGSEASGVWSVGTIGAKTGLTGGFGVMHVGDTAGPKPSGDDGSSAEATLVTTSQATVSVGGNDIDVGSATIRNGKLTVELPKYGWTGSTYGVLIDDKGTTDDTTDDEAVTIKEAFDLATLAGKAAGATTTNNGPKHIETVINTIEAQREQLATLQGLNLPTEEAKAWVKVQNAVRYGLLFGQIPLDLEGTYSSTADGRQEALRLIDSVLDALSSQSNLLAALDPKSTGIFRLKYSGNADDTSTTTVDESIGGPYRYYDEAQRRFEVNEAPKSGVTQADHEQGDGTGKANGRTIGNLFGEREYKVISTLGTTNFTRFGAWRRESTRSAARRAANDNDGAQNIASGHGGPGTFAYSPLDPSVAGNDTNPGFLAGGSARYTGETVAVQGITMLTGTLLADVSWASSTDSPTGTALDLALDRADTLGQGPDTTSHAGLLTLTISDLANLSGDPVSHGGTASNKGNEITDIVLGGFAITVGEGPNAGGLVVGTAVLDATDTTKVIGYNEVDVAETSATFRFGRVGLTDIDGDTTDNSAGTKVKALFVGQGVDGPLGLIGTWTLTDAAVGRFSADGTKADNIGATIRGAFGAELP